MNLRLFTVVAGCTVALAFAAAAETVVVSPLDMHGWAFLDDQAGGPCVAPNCEMVNGPQNPPAGKGSAHFLINSTRQGNILAAPIDRGTRLDHITKLNYFTYEAPPTAPLLATALQLVIDYDLTDTNTTYQGRLVYEPYNNGVVAPQTWQSWDALNGGNARWWFTRAPGNTACGQSHPCTLSVIKHMYPNIGIHNTLGGVLFKAGSGWTIFDGNVDKLTIGILGADDTTYDFELGPTNKDECKDGGWIGYFKNQGQCVSHFNLVD